MPKKDAGTLKKKGGWVGRVFYGFFLFLVLGISTIFGWARGSSVLTRVLIDMGTILNKDPREAFGGHDVETILLLGCDEDRVYGGKDYAPGKIVRNSARSDMMLVARLDFVHNQVTGLSIPRDTECSLPDVKGGKHKINAFYSIAKPDERNELTKRAVEHILPGVKIDDVIAINYERFEDLVNLVGGVTMNINKKLDYDDYAGDLHIHFNPGVQHLNGDKAIELMRFRHDKESDAGRQERQHEFLIALKASAVQNWERLPSILEQGKHVLGDTFNDNQVLALAAFSRKLPPNGIQMTSLPTTPGSGTFLKVDVPARDALLKQLGFVTATDEPDKESD